MSGMDEELLTTARNNNGFEEWLEVWKRLNLEGDESRILRPVKKEALKGLVGAHTARSKCCYILSLDWIEEGCRSMGGKRETSTEVVFDLSAALPASGLRLTMVEDRVPGLKELVGFSRSIKLSDLIRTASKPRERPHSSESKKREARLPISTDPSAPDWTTKKHKKRRSVHSETDPNVKQPDPIPSFRTAKSKLLEDHQKKFGHSEDYKPSFLLKKHSGQSTKPKLAPLTDNSTQDNGPLSARSLALLSRGSDSIPDEIRNFDLALVEAVCSEILDDGSPIGWDDIAGQDTAKALVQELVVWPMKNPHLFTGARTPPKGLLLFGPPGTGKTLIGKAIASNVHATFFSISASSLTSKWIGDGEKMVKILFAVAKSLQPTVIFIDEIDSILTARKSDGEHESSRRLKTELLVQMDGCGSSSDGTRILVVGATNRPQELDEAARRRLPKQLYIPLPCSIARSRMIHDLLGEVKCDLSDKDVAKIVEKTDGYSGADMRNLMQEACQGPVRDMFNINGRSIGEISESALRPVVLKDFQMAARVQKPSVDPSEIQHYVEYDAKHGAKIAPDVTSLSDEDWN